MKKGFTLIELLVMIAVTSIITAALFPIFAKAREKALEKTCITNQKIIATHTMMYVQENEETMPPAGNWAVSIGVQGKILICPKAVKDEVSYGYNEQVSGLWLGDILDPVDTILTADATKEIITSIDDIAPRHAGNAIASFVDSHTVIISPEEIEKFLADFKIRK